MGDELLLYENSLVPIDLGKWGTGESYLRWPGFMKPSVPIY